MKLLVTGGSGFVGRRVVAAARARGHDVVLLARDPERAARATGARALAADLGDKRGLARILESEAPDALVHLASVVRDDAPDLLAVNVDGTAHVVAALQAAAPSCRLVYVSSFAVEDIPPTPYSRSKLAAEGLVREARVPWVVVRPALVYGPHDPNNTGPLADKLRSGTHWLPAGGSTRIQPAFVDDVADALVAACERDTALGGTYCLGGPHPIPVGTWRTRVRDSSGGSARLRALPLALLEPVARALAWVGSGRALGVLQFHLADHAVDSEPARRDLGYVPRSYDDGLRATFNAAAAPAGAAPTGRSDPPRG